VWIGPSVSTDLGKWTTTASQKIVGLLGSVHFVHRYRRRRCGDGDGSRGWRVVPLGCRILSRTEQGQGLTSLCTGDAMASERLHVARVTDPDTRSVNAEILG